MCALGNLANRLLRPHRALAGNKVIGAVTDDTFPLVFFVRTSAAIATASVSAWFALPQVMRANNFHSVWAELEFFSDLAQRSLFTTTASRSGALNPA